MSEPHRRDHFSPAAALAPGPADLGFLSHWGWGWGERGGRKNNETHAKLTSQQTETTFRATRREQWSREKTQPGSLSPETEGESEFRRAWPALWEALGGCQHGCHQPPRRDPSRPPGLLPRVAAFMGLCAAQTRRVVQRAARRCPAFCPHCLDSCCRHLIAPPGDRWRCDSLRGVTATPSSPLLSPPTHPQSRWTCPDCCGRLSLRLVTPAAQEWPCASRRLQPAVSNESGGEGRPGRHLPFCALGAS